MGVYVLHHHHKRGDSETDMILILYVVIVSLAHIQVRAGRCLGS